MYSLICAWANGWANNRDVVKPRCHCAHYDVTVMTESVSMSWRPAVSTHGFDNHSPSTLVDTAHRDTRRLGRRRVLHSYKDYYMPRRNSHLGNLNVELSCRYISMHIHIYDIVYMMNQWIKYMELIWINLIWYNHTDITHHPQCQNRW